MPASAAELYAAGQERVARTLLLARREWDAVSDPRDVDASKIERLLAASMVGAAQDGAASVGADLLESGFDVVPDGQVVLATFALAASDGRPLGSLIGRAVVIAREYGMGAGRVSLDRIVHTQVQDAARAASSVAIASRPRVGWVRFVNPPCCQDCAVLAGKWFKWNQGFKRHPHCDCVHRPAHQDESPSGYTQTVDPDRIHDLTDAQRAALREGADLGRVVNAYRRDPRRMATAGARQERLTTRELSGRGERLTPDGIFARAKTREEAVGLLATHGYLAT